MILRYVYTETPSMVRIKSESLCLDHTFVPGVSKNFVSFNDLVELLESKYIDSIHAFVPKDAKAYYICPISNEKIPIYGWIDLSLFGVAEPYVMED